MRFEVLMVVNLKTYQDLASATALKS